MNRGGLNDLVGRADANPSASTWSASCSCVPNTKPTFRALSTAAASLAFPKLSVCSHDQSLVSGALDRSCRARADVRRSASAIARGRHHRHSQTRNRWIWRNCPNPHNCAKANMYASSAVVSRDCSPSTKAWVREDDGAIQSRYHAGDESYLNNGRCQPAECRRLTQPDPGGEALPKPLAILPRDEVCHVSESSDRSCST